MSETTQEREQETVVGVVEGVTKKRPDTWQISVRPEGSQYTKGLWSKSAEMVERAEAMVGDGITRSFECNASYWQNQSGNQVRSLWLERVSENGAQTEIQESGAAGGPPPSQPSSEARREPTAPKRAAAPEKSDVDWDAKERRDYRSRAWAQALAALAQHWPADAEADEAFGNRVYVLQRRIYRDVVRELDPDAHPDDGIPF